MRGSTHIAYSRPNSRRLYSDTGATNANADVSQFNLSLETSGQLLANKASADTHAVAHIFLVFVHAADGHREQSYMSLWTFKHLSSLLIKPTHRMVYMLFHRVYMYRYELSWLLATNQGERHCDNARFRSALAPRESLKDDDSLTPL